MIRTLSLVCTLLCINSSVLGQTSNYEAHSAGSHSIYSSITGVNGEPELFHDFSLSSFQLITASIQVEKQKIIFSPLKLSQNYYNPLSELQLNLAQDKGISTIGLGITFLKKPASGEAAQRILHSLLSKVESKRPPTKEEESTETGKIEYKTYEKKYDKKFRETVYVAFYDSLLGENPLSVTLGFNTQLFEIIGGDKIDLDQDGKNDNEYTMKAWDISAGLTYSPNQSFGANLICHLTRKRSSSVEGQQMLYYYGLALSSAWKVADLEDEDKYKASDDYVKSMFIPSVVVGLSIEFQKCTGNNSFIEDGIKEKIVLTPFVDFKLATKSQFRLGLPVKRFVPITKTTKVELGPFVQFSVQLSTAN